MRWVPLSTELFCLFALSILPALFLNPSAFDCGEEGSEIRSPSRNPSLFGCSLLLILFNILSLTILTVFKALMKARVHVWMCRHRRKDHVDWHVHDTHWLCVMTVDSTSTSISTVCDWNVYEDVDFMQWWISIDVVMIIRPCSYLSIYPKKVSVHNNNW